VDNKLNIGLKNRGERMEHIIIIDEDDNYIGEEDKEKCHDGNGILHRGFLAMVFNNAGELLLAQRSGGSDLSLC